jgi:predicted small metal-binding protein
MAKLLRCRDVGADCNFEVRGETEEEILQKAGQHAQSVHKMQVTNELVAAVRRAIKNV